MNFSEIGKKYNRHKQNALDLCERFNKFDPVKYGDGVDREFLNKQVENLKKGKFNIVVAGEVKAGKSTFINAFLQKKILPSNVLQATSAIIEICNSDEHYVQIKYGDGHTEVIFNDPDTEVDESLAKLTEIGSISEKYREIPTTLLDDIILDEKSDINDESDVDEEFIQWLEEKSNTKLTEKRNLIKEYIFAHPPEKIVTEIKVGYSLKWDFEGMSIIDSPGVNARGGVQHRTFEYIDNAQAILFVKNIKPVESETFHEFVKTNITDRSKDLLFLVLTHAGPPYTGSDVNKLFEETKRLYSTDTGYITPEQLIPVDSVLQLVKTEMEETGKSIEELPEEQQELIPRSCKDINDITKRSNFQAIDDVLTKFSCRAPLLQVREIIEKVKYGYENRLTFRLENIELLKKKLKDPELFDKEITRLEAEIDHFTSRIRDFVNGIEFMSYTRQNDEIDQLKQIFQYGLSSIKDENTLFNNCRKFVGYIETIIKEAEDNIVQTLSKKYTEIGLEFKNKNSFTIPNLDFESFKKSAKDEAFYDKEVFSDKKRTWDQWDVLGLGMPRIFRESRIKLGTQRVVDEDKYIENLKNEVDAFVAQIGPVNEKIEIFLASYKKMFETEVFKLISERKNEIITQNKSKKTNKETAREIEYHIKRNKIYEEELETINKWLKDIEPES